MLDIPFNAILICYGPLAVVVLGFIFFAVLTDANARRSYLRRSLVTEPVTTAFTAQTPSGAEVLIRPAGVKPTVIGESERPPELDAAASAPAVVTPEPEVISPDDVEVEDDLSQISGIGPKTIEALHASGIKTYAQIAEMTGEELTRIVKEEHGVRIVGDMANTWPRQAQFLVNGDIEGLQAYQDEISNNS